MEKVVWTGRKKKKLRITQSQGGQKNLTLQEEEGQLDW
jgi:hypothetical protein